MSDITMRISKDPLSLTVLIQYLAKTPRLELDDQTKRSIRTSHQIINNILNSNQPVYGVNTGFGKFAEVRIKTQAVAELQKRLILSHSAGVGPPIPREIVRLIMLLKIKALSLAHSGCRIEIIQMLIDMLNRNIIPVIPSKGSVGASGDLAPLAHLALVMIGEGDAFIQNDNKKGKCEWQRVDGKVALKRHGLEPISFEAKEGLAILNGTQVMTAYAIWSLIQTKNLIKVADIVGAISLEALLASLTPFDKRIQELRPHPGQKLVAANIRKILSKSSIVESHKTDHDIVQDAYSLRCIPQVHGAVRDALNFIESVLLIEVNSVTDNPLIFPQEGAVLSGGNFHGAPIAYTSDLMSIVITDLANISERRVQHLLDPAVNQLTPFLIEEGGLNSGFMMAQVTAAALVSEAKVLSHPASVDSIPTSANKEDHVSMGTYAARKCTEIILNLEHILSIELLCGCQALNLRAPLTPAKTTAAILDYVRSTIPFWNEDRLMAKDITSAKEMVRSGEIVNTAEKICGPLT
jgi:histidine ammonia-lyase